MTAMGEAATVEGLRRLVRGRQSCRAYRPDPVPHAVIEELLALAQHAPSWCNTQPWQVTVTEGAATDRFRAALLEEVSGNPAGLAPDIAMPERYEGVHLERRRESGWQLYEAVGVARGDREASQRQAMRNFELFGAPHVAIVTVDRGLGPYAVLDTGVYVGHLLLAAHALGLGAIAQAALATHSPFVRAHFGIPEDRAVVVGISFGYPDLTHPANGYRTSRADLGGVARFVTA